MGCFIYSIVRKGTDKCYVGSTTRKQGRKKEHFRLLRAGKHHSSYLQNSWNKYGEEAFIFKVLAKCSESERKATEMLWIENSNSCYNMWRVVEGNFTPSKATRRRLKESHKGLQPSPEARANHRAAMSSIEVRTKLADAQRGKVLSTETRAKMSKSHTGRKVSEETRCSMRAGWLKRGPVSEETKRNMSKAGFRRARPSRDTRLRMSVAIRKVVKPKLSECEVLKIRRMYASGKHTLKAIGDRFSVTKQTIFNVVHCRRAYAHVGRDVHHELPD